MLKTQNHKKIYKKINIFHTKKRFGIGTKCYNRIYSSDFKISLNLMKKNDHTRTLKCNFIKAIYRFTLRIKSSFFIRITSALTRMTFFLCLS